MRLFLRLLRIKSFYLHDVAALEQKVMENKHKKLPYRSGISYLNYYIPSILP